MLEHCIFLYLCMLIHSQPCLPAGVNCVFSSMVLPCLVVGATSMPAVSLIVSLLRPARTRCMD